MADDYTREDEPRFIRAGDTAKWTKSVANYLYSDGWRLAYRLIGSNGAYSIATVVNPDDADGFLATVLSAASALYTAGKYSLYGYVTKGAERHTVIDGLEVEVLANPATATASDTRSHNRKVLDAIKAVIENRATYDQLEREVDGIRLKNRPYAELLLLLDRYEQRYAAEIARKRGKAFNFGQVRIQPRDPS